MNNDEAKFILAVYRPGGQDATDPLFAEPLAQACRDPELKAWFKAQLAFDSVVSVKLREVPPPPGLREMILAGARVSRPDASSWPRHWLFAAAAAAVILLSALVTIQRSAPVGPGLADLTRFAVRDTLINGKEHFGSVPAIHALEERLAETHFRSGADLNLDLARLRANGCRTVRVAGREVFEICFGRDHEFHLYVAKRVDFAAAGADQPEFMTQVQPAVATWLDSRLAYALVTRAETDSLRRRF
jgi:hypothetical protein